MSNKNFEIITEKQCLRDLYRKWIESQEIVNMSVSEHKRRARIFIDEHRDWRSAKQHKIAAVLKRLELDNAITMEKAVAILENEKSMYPLKPMGLFPLQCMHCQRPQKIICDLYLGSTDTHILLCKKCLKGAFIKAAGTNISEEKVNNLRLGYTKHTPSNEPRRLRKVKQCQTEQSENTNLESSI